MNSYKHRKIWVYNDKITRKLTSVNELNRLILKSMLSLNKNLFKKVYFTKIFNKYGKKSALSLSRNYCNFTGTGRSVFKLFKINRHELKKNASYGFFTGMRKSSF